MSLDPTAIQEFSIQDPPAWLQVGDHEAYLGLRGPVSINGGFDPDRAEEAVASGLADLVSFGQLFLANPGVPERFSERAPLNTLDRETFYGGDAGGYTRLSEAVVAGAVTSRAQWREGDLP